MELQWDGGTKVCLGGLGAMPIYGTNLLEIFPGTKGPVTLRPDVQHWGLGPKKVCSNDDPGLTFTFFYGKVKFPYAFIWENIHFFRKMLESHLMKDIYNK